MPFVRFIKLAALSAAIACSALTGSAAAQTIELKLSHFVPPQHAFHKWVDGLDGEDRKGIQRPAQVHDLSQRPARRSAEPAVRRRAQRHHRHRLVPARRDAGPLSGDRARQPAVRLAGHGARHRRNGQAHDRAGAEIFRRRAHRPAHPVHVDGQSGGGLFQESDPQARRLQGHEDPLRLARQQGDARRARRHDHADPAAGVAGRAGQGHRPGRDLPARGRPRLRSRVGGQVCDPSAAWRRRPSRW